MDLKETNSKFEPFNKLELKEKEAIFELIDFKLKDDMKEVLDKIEGFALDLKNSISMSEIKLEAKMEVLERKMDTQMERNKNSIILWISTILIGLFTSLILIFIKLK